MQAPRIYRCVCGGEYNSQKGLDQHKRRYCRGVNTNEANKCETCEATFNTFAGLRQHVKKSHPAIYNSNLQEEVRGPSRFWTEDEENDLAKAEATYEGEDLLEHLCTKSSRSKEAIKCRRKQQSYKEKVRLVKESLTNVTTPTETETDISLIEQLNERLRQAIIDINPANLETNSAQLREDLLSSEIEVARYKFDAWCESWIKIDDSTRNRQGANQINVLHKNLLDKIKDPTISSHKRRVLRFKLAQMRFKNDRKAYANDLLDGLEEETEEVYPSKEDILNSYEDIFGTPSAEDPEPTNQVQRETVEISSAISLAEIGDCIKTMKNGAPGPDGINLEKLKKINSNKILLLFNSILYLEYLPKCLKICRTTLIPKSKGNRNEIKNWRPITISSILTRLLGKILAKRTNNIELNRSQKGFTKLDGCFANNIILENLIKHSKKNGQPLTLISLDLQKAFDCVSHQSITRALERLKIDRKFINIIRNFYNGVKTNIFCGGKFIGDMEIKRGVKQGDPLSPFIFNAVIDEIIDAMDRREGVRLGNGVKICSLAYADDMILIAKTPEDAGRMLNLCVDFFSKRGLALNVSKCTAITFKTVPSKKKLCVLTEPTLKVGDAWIPQLTISEEFKYLGRKFNYEGLVPCDADNLHSQLSAITRAPLKPQQKLNILKTYLIPRYIDSLQRPNITKKILKKVDLQIRTTIKKILHLPLHCSNSTIYAPLKMGGLGIFYFTRMIPIISLDRSRKLSETDHHTRAALSINTSWQQRLQNMIDPEIDTMKKLKIQLGINIEESFSGNGITHSKYHQACSQIIADPPRFWNGEDFIKAIHLRLNLLPTKGIPCVNIHDRRCRAGCFKTESLSHVLQGCQATHWERIHRHDYVLKRLITSASKRQWSTTIEPHIRNREGRLQKPDAILIKGEDLIVTDVAVNWEGRIPLSTQYENKVTIYSNAPFIEELRRRYPDKNIYVLPLILGARGTWCKNNNALTRRLGLGYADCMDLITTAMRGGWRIHAAFMRRVWR